MTEKKEKKQNKKRTGLFVFICIVAFILSFIFGVASTNIKPWTRKYIATWNENVGTVYKDIEYGDKDANKFDLYVPADTSKASYGLVVYLHAGGFTTGDKSDDAQMLKWLCSKGYIAAGINYTLFNEENTDANVYTQSMEIKESMPYVVEVAKNLGYNIDRMAIAGGSAGGCHALLYAYRDSKEALVPVKMVFETVGPSSFYPEDWASYGLNDSKEAAAVLFSLMSGEIIEPEMFGTKEYDDAIKNISALLWVDENTVPTLMAYGAYDRIQPYEASVRLDKKLTECNVPHDYIVLEHSGHGLQNDDEQLKLYYEKIEEYLDKYMAQ